MLKQLGRPGCGSAAPGRAGTAASSGQRLFTSQRAMSPSPPGLRILAHSIIGGVESPELSCDRFLIAQTSERNLLVADNGHFSLRFCAQQAVAAEELSRQEKCFPALLLCAVETPACLL